MAGPDINELSTVLVAMTDRLEQLMVLLEKERLLLQGQDPGAIQSLAEKKMQLTEQLEKLEEQRQQLFQQAGIAGDPQAMQAWLKHSARNDLCNIWNALETRLSQCAEQNLVNGMIVENGRQRVRLAMDLLHGSAPQNDLYNAKGSMVSAPRGPHLSRT